MLTGMKMENAQPPSSNEGEAPNGSTNQNEEEMPPEPSPRLQR